MCSTSAHLTVVERRDAGQPSVSLVQLGDAEPAKYRRALVYTQGEGSCEGLYWQQLKVSQSYKHCFNIHVEKWLESQIIRIRNIS